MPPLPNRGSFPPAAVICPPVLALLLPVSTAELLQEVERELLSHVAVDFAPGDPAVESWCSGRVHALFHLLDDVHRRGAAEPGDQRAWATRRGS